MKVHEWDVNARCKIAKCPRCKKNESTECPNRNATVRKRVETCKTQTQHDHTDTAKNEITINSETQTQQQTVAQFAEQSLEQSLAQRRRDELLIVGMNSCADHRTEEDNQVSNRKQPCT